MRKTIISLTIIAFILMLLGLATPVLGEIGTCVLVIPFSITLMEIGRVTMPGKGAR